MVYILCFCMISLALATNCSEYENSSWDDITTTIRQIDENLEKDSDEWLNLLPFVEENEKEAKNNTIEAFKTLEYLHDLYQRLEKDNLGHTIKLSDILTKIETLYERANLPKNERTTLNHSITTNTENQRFEWISTDYLNASIAVAENMFKRILANAQSLGLYPDGFSTDPKK